MLMGHRPGLCDGEQGEEERGRRFYPGGLSRVVVLDTPEADVSVLGTPSAMIFSREAKILRRWSVPSELHVLDRRTEYLEVVVNFLVLAHLVLLLFFLATCGYSSCPCVHSELETALGDSRQFTTL